MLKKIHHVGVVVRSADEALRFYRDLLGLPVAKDQVIEDQGVRGVLLPAGESEIELLEPTREGTGVARFLEKGEGLHHVCFESDDVGAELAAAKAKGLRLIDEQPRPGLAGMIGFVHPGATHGVLVEFATPPAGGHAPAPGPLIKNFDHAVFAVKDLDAGVQTWERNFGFKATERRDVPALGIANAILPVNGANAFVELITPLGEGPVQKSLDEKGEGMYLISLEVTDMDTAVATLREAGVRVGDPTGATGSGRLAFVSPRNTHGVSIQLRERP
ncbi:MAG TPA: methylmalonyl-CoA epimerase [Dehalococcoidia bacterium]|nr:methylmalonyl-CoA epimerase [Dehalococcoidia bacterium]